MMYRDNRGYLYTVNASIINGVQKYKAYCRNPMNGHWYQVKSLEWSKTAKEAEEELARFARNMTPMKNRRRKHG